MKAIGFKLVTFLLISSAFMSCGDDDDETLCEPQDSSSLLKLRFNPTWNGVPVEAASEFEDQFGNRLRLFNFKSFISHAGLEGDDGEVELSEVELLSFNEGSVELTYEIPNGSSFHTLNFSTGVPAEYNVDYDPSTWPNSHPLSIQGAQGMHWEWNTGYKFTIFDGKADTTDAVTPTYIYSYTFHCGDDSFYSDHEFPIDLTTLTESEHTIEINVQMEKFLDGESQIDIRDDGETHTGGDFDLAEDFVNNFNSSFVLE